MSIQGIQQNPQDTSNFYLANIYQTLTDPSQSNTSISPASPTPFSPLPFAVWVNALWFLSLVISLTCALLATLLQQWARRYLKLTQSRYSPHKRARIRAFLAEGVDKLLLPWTVDTLPTLLHISLFLFFAGLVVFLWNVNLTIFKLVLSWVGVCTALYGCMTFMPLVRRDSPYHTPLSLPAWHIVTGTLFLTFCALRRLTSDWDCLAVTYFRFCDLADRYGKLLVLGVRKTIEETALNLPSEIDTRTFMWTFDNLDEDHELEHFFSGLPGFRSSKVTEDPLPTLAEQQKWRLLRAMAGLLDRTFSSDLLPAPVKARRAMLCAKAAEPAHISGAFSVLPMTLSENFNEYRGPLAADILQIVRDWGNSEGEDDTLYAQATISMVITRAQPRDDCWFSLASKSLGVPEAVLRDYAAIGDSLSLATLIHITRQQFTHFQELSWPLTEIWKVLGVASKFAVQDTSPELQHEFCALWNQIVHKAQNEYSLPMVFYILRSIRGVYITLHQDTDSAPTQFSASTGDWDGILALPDSYPVCNIPGHHPDSTPHIHASATFVHTAPHDLDHNNTAPVPSFLAGNLDTPPLSANSPLRVDESFTDAPPLNDIISGPVSLQPVDQITPDSCCTPATSPNPVTTHATHGSNDNSARAMHLSTPEPLAFTFPAKSQASTPPPDAIAIENTPVGRTPSLEVPSSPSPNQVLGNMLSTGLPLSSDSVITESDNASSPPVSHSSMLAPNVHGPSRPWVFSAPDLGAAAEGEGGAKAALRTEKDASSGTRDSKAS